MIKHIALSALPFLFGCSDFWGTYQLLDAGSSSDASFEDMVVDPCTSRTVAYSQKESVFTTCCYTDNSALSGKNVQAAILDAQASSYTDVTVRIGCPEPRQLPLEKLSSSAPLGEESLLPAITKKVTVDGLGSTLDAQGKERHFFVGTNASLTLKNIKLVNGIARTIPDSNRWSPLAEAYPTPTNMACGGAVLSFGPLTLENVFLSENTATHTKYAAGGALCLGTTNLTMRNSIIYNNNAESGNTNGFTKGAGAYLFLSSATVNNSTVLQNTNKIPTNTTLSAAAFHFDDFPTKTPPIPMTFVSKNSLFVNFYSRDFTGSGSTTQNYALHFPCHMSNPPLGTNVFDEALFTPTCQMKPIGSSSSLMVKYTGNPWPAPSGSQTTISPNVGMWDAAMRDLSNLDACLASGKDFFGNPRPNTKCMPGAVEPRTN